MGQQNIKGDSAALRSQPASRTQVSCAVERAVSEIRSRVERGASFYPVACMVCDRERLSYGAVRNAYFLAVHGKAEMLPEIYNAGGGRVA